MNYKQIDRDKIMDYIFSRGGECSVADIILESGAEKLRVYNILFDEFMAGRIVNVKETYLGAPEVVKLV
jgi:hypothetical protein